MIVDRDLHGDSEAAVGVKETAILKCISCRYMNATNVLKSHVRDKSVCTVSAETRDAMIGL